MFVSRLKFYFVIIIAPAILCSRDDYYDNDDNFEGPEDTNLTKNSLRETDVGNTTSSKESEVTDEDYMIMSIYSTELSKEVETKKVKLLRQSAPIQSELYTATMPTVRPTSKDITRIEDYIYDYENDVTSTESYIFENATDSYDQKDNTTDDYSKDVDSWVVPEQIPCWELPVLYGEMKPRKHEVFSIHIEELRVVKYENQTEERSSTHLPQIQENIHNKWCLKGPCYADHTLCFFANTNSVFCDIRYKIKTPNVLEQMAIVNTVNAMRNRVATGQSKTYKHLPTAANMKQLSYNYDLQKMAKTWLRQCLPGPAPCSSFKYDLTGELECTKHAKICCLNKEEGCKPLRECFVSAIIGCIHVWFQSAGTSLTANHIRCGHIHRNTYHTVQLLWASTSRVGCASGRARNGDVRVLCYFAPGAPFRLTTKYYCGIISHHDITDRFNSSEDVTSTAFAAKIGITIIDHHDTESFTDHQQETTSVVKEEQSHAFGIDSLHNIYKPGWARSKGDDSANNTSTNVTLGYIARMVTKYRFRSAVHHNCSESVYYAGPPGSSCSVRGRRFSSLCYEYGDPAPEYRLVAILAPVALFSLILYDLFSGVVRQTNF